MSIFALIIALAAQQPIPDRYLDQFLAANDALEANDLPRAKQLFERALELRPENPTCAYDLACVAARNGDAKSSLEWLARAVDWDYVDADVALWDSDLASLRTTSEFKVATDAMRSHATNRPRALRGQSELANPVAFTKIERREGELLRHGVNQMLASGDATTLTFSSSTYDKPVATKVSTIELPSAKLVGEFALRPGGVCSLSRAADGNVRVVTAEGRTLRIRDAKSGAIQTEFELPASGNVVASLAPSPDLSRTVVCSEGSDALLVDLASKRVIADLCDTHDPWCFVAWSNDGARFATASYDLPVRIRRGVDGAEILPRVTSSSPIDSIGLDRDGKRLAIGDYDGHARIVDVDSGELIADFFHEGVLQPGSNIGCVAFSPDGNLLLTTSDTFGLVYIWDLRTNARVWSYELGSGNGCWLPADFSRDGSRIYIRSPWSGEASVFDAKSGKRLANLDQFEVRGLVATPNDRWIAGVAMPNRGGIVAIGATWVRVFDGNTFAAQGAYAIDDCFRLSLTAARYCAGPLDEIIATPVVVSSERYTLAEFAAVLVDPKRVRAASKDVKLEPARMGWPPKLAVVGSTELHVATNSPTIEFDVDIEDSLGFSGCEAEIDGRVIDRELLKAFADVGPAPSAKRVHLAIARGPSNKESSLWIRAIGRSGVASRTLHLRVVAEP